jgi:uncharacterized protein
MNICEKELLEKTRQYVKNYLEQQQVDGGHDWWHIHRVERMALYIAQKEKADRLIVNLGGLLHDIGDYKFHRGDETVGPRLARQWLESLGVEESVIAPVCDIIETISFKGAGAGASAQSHMKTLEGKVVQDSDRLDAIGAVGIARTFAYGGHKGRELYNPNIKPQWHEDFNQYKNNRSPTINHFYEKLLLLKNRMNTDTARKIAVRRHDVMEQFLKQFYEEWNFS